MARETITVLLNWLSGMMNERILHEDPIQDILNLCYPFRGDITTTHNPGEMDRSGVFDTTGTLAADGFSNLLKSSMLPANTDWIKFEPPFDLRDNLRVRDVYDKSAQRLQRAMNVSNFNQEAGIFLRDFSILGNGIMFAQSRDSLLNRAGVGGFNGLIFKAAFFNDIWWTPGIDGVEVVVQRVMMPALKAVRFFGERDAGDTARKAVMEKEFMKPIEFRHFVYLNQQPIQGGLPSPDNSPWISHWIVRDDATDGWEETVVRGMEHNPYIVGRWTTTQGDIYGTGIGHLVRPDIAGLNEFARQIYIAAQRDLNPPIMVEHESVLDLDTGPNGVIVAHPFQKIQPQYLNTNSRYDVVADIRLEDRKKIRAAFMAELFEDPETQPRSAQESIARQERGFTRFAAPADVSAEQFLGPVIDTSLSIMLSEGALPELAELIFEFGALEIIPEFTSPFFTAQKQAPIQRVDAFLQRRFNYFQLSQDESWLEDINPRGVTALDRRLSDVPAEIFFTEEEVQRNAAAKNEQFQREQRREDADSLAKVAGATKSSLPQVQEAAAALEG